VTPHRHCDGHQHQHHRETNQQRSHCVAPLPVLTL
jgi:hypothetical protein